MTSSRPVSSLPPPPDYVVKAGIGDLFSRLGHRALAHGQWDDSMSETLGIACMTVHWYFKWHRTVAEKGEQATIEDRNELEGYRREARQWMANWGGLPDNRRHVAEIDSEGRDVDLVALVGTGWRG